MPNPLSNALPIVSPTEENIVQAAEILRAGGLVAFPTETVYGLGAAAENEEAVRAVYATKGRPSHNPLIVHVTDPDMAERYGQFTETAGKVRELFSQGLTLVLPLRAGSVAVGALGGGDTVALRIPRHPVAQALLASYGAGIAAPSANRSGRISPTRASHVWEEFGESPGALRLILDGGECGIGLESTVVDCSGEIPRLLRAGSIPLERLFPLLPSLHTGTEATAAADPLRSPGMLESHYAPRATVRLNATDAMPGEAFLAFGPPPALQRDIPFLNLSASADPEEAAYHLYDYLRRLDMTGALTIAVMPIPPTGIGLAVNDRLNRAAAKR